MQFFLKLPTDRTLVYTSGPTDKIIDVKRQAIRRMRENDKVDIPLVMVYSMYIAYNGKLLFDHYLVKDYVAKDTTMHLYFRSGIVAKDRTQEFIIYVNIDGYKNVPKFSVFCSPDDPIEYLVKCIIEELYMIQKHSFTYDSVCVMYNNLILNPNKNFAEYDQISSSYMKFKNDDNLFDNTTLIGDFLHQYPNGYYCMSVGDRKDKKPHLILKKRNVVFKEIKMNTPCIICENFYAMETPYVMITPCCRKRVCTRCMKRILDHHKCTCGESC